MSELKTLKDLPNESRYDADKDIKLDAVLVETLKQEAIKRVKSCCKDDNVGGTPLRKSPRCGGCIRDIWFNNLTEEDLG